MSHIIAGCNARKRIRSEVMTMHTTFRCPGCKGQIDIQDCEVMDRGGRRPRWTIAAFCCGCEFALELLRRDGKPKKVSTVRRQARMFAA